MIRITLDGRKVEASEGASLLQVALDNGVYIPHFCYHPSLSKPASCRLCLVEIEGEGEPELVTACDTRIADGMVVATQTERVAEARRSVIEFALFDHPLECPVCDKAGECELQDFSRAYGAPEGRSDEVKSHREKRSLGERVILYPDRCIGCSRCVRFCEEITKTGELALFARGGSTEPDVFAGDELDNPMAGNVVDLCPVGALVEPDALYRQPVWSLKGIDSICPGCSSGCNVRVDVSGGRIQRLKPRVNPQVNGYWMCDEGRYGWEYVHGEERLSQPAVKREGRLVEVSWDEAIEEVAQRLGRRYGPETIAVIFSGWQTNEEVYLFAKLAMEGWQTHRAGIRVRGVADGDVSYADGFTIRAEKAPNGRGVHEVGTESGLEFRNMERLWEEIESGSIRAAFWVCGDPVMQLTGREQRALERLELLAVLDTAESELSARADVLFPGLTPFEKEGSFTNVDGRVQRVRQALRSRSIPFDWQVAVRLANASGCAWHYDHPRQVIAELGGLLGGGYAELEEDRFGDGRGPAYGGGWVAQMQRQGFIHVADHTKSA